ncbi:MAG: MurR/RpiR family transcriptional regulator [Rhodoferax sp.]|nr:MurR/RpiR family transcriptional regulator [Rhodoferax sp.]
MTVILSIARRTSVAQSETTTVDQLIRRITSEYEGLSKQLKVIGRYIEQHRGHLGLEGIQSVATQCNVQPSAVVRFAKHFGFSGFSEMQALFREGLTRQLAPNRNYKKRIRDAIDAGAGNLSSVDIAQEFFGGSITAMQELQGNLDATAFKKAVDLLVESDTVWVAASRRSFPVAVYLDYALQHTDKRVSLVSAAGSMQLGQVRSVREGDVMIAISFTPYSRETLDVVEFAVQRGAKVLAITDTRMNPLARLAQIALVVHDNSTLGFRSLTSSMALAQSLFVALAYKTELLYRPNNGAKA